MKSLKDRNLEYLSILKMQMIAAHALVVLLREDSAAVSRYFASDMLGRALHELLMELNSSEVSLPIWFYDAYGNRIKDE